MTLHSFIEVTHWLIHLFKLSTINWNQYNSLLITSVLSKNLCDFSIWRFLVGAFTNYIKNLMTLGFRFLQHCLRVLMLQSQGKQVNKQQQQQKQQQNWLNNKKVVNSDVDVMHEQCMNTSFSK